MTSETHAAGGAGPGEGAGRPRRMGVWRRGRGEGAETGSLPVAPSGAGAPAVPGPDDELSTETAELGALVVADGAGEQDWMTAARMQAERARHADLAATAWAPGGALPEPDQDGAPASLVRPYARTGGRTKPVRDLSLEALVRTSLSGKEASASPWLSPEHSAIIQLCNGTASVAEIAAQLSVPIGVARVIIADMVDLGLVEVMKTSASEGDERDPDFLRRVLSGLQRL